MSKKPRKPSKAYFVALGRFVDQFASLETILSLSLRVVSGVPSPNARALFHGVRTDAAAQYITRLLAVNGSDQTTKADYKRTFTQLGHITRARNDLLHYGASFSGKTLITSNKLWALTDEHIREMPISAETLTAMSDDLRKIKAHLVYQMIRTIEPNGKSGDDELDEMIDAQRRASWLYKPPQPASRRGKSRAKNPKQ